MTEGQKAGVVLAACLAGLAVLLSVISLTRPQPSQGNNVVQAAEQYVTDYALQNGAQVDNEKVIAYRVNGNDAVVRVAITFRPFFQVAPGRRLYGPTSHVTLVVKLHKSSWTPGYLVVAK